MMDDFVKHLKAAELRFEIIIRSRLSLPKLYSLRTPELKIQLAGLTDSKIDIRLINSLDVPDQIAQISDGLASLPNDLDAGISEKKRQRIKSRLTHYILRLKLLSNYGNLEDTDCIRDLEQLSVKCGDILSAYSMHISNDIIDEIYQNTNAGNLETNNSDVEQTESLQSDIIVHEADNMLNSGVITRSRARLMSSQLNEGVVDGSQSENSVLDNWGKSNKPSESLKDTTRITVHEKIFRRSVLLSGDPIQTDTSISSLAKGNYAFGKNNYIREPDEQNDRNVDWKTSIVNGSSVQMGELYISDTRHGTAVKEQSSVNTLSPGFIHRGEPHITQDIASRGMVPERQHDYAQHLEDDINTSQGAIELQRPQRTHKLNSSVQTGDLRRHPPSHIHHTTPHQTLRQGYGLTQQRHLPEELHHSHHVNSSVERRVRRLQEPHRSSRQDISFTYGNSHLGTRAGNATLPTDYCDLQDSMPDECDGAVYRDTDQRRVRFRNNSEFVKQGDDGVEARVQDTESNDRKIFWGDDVVPSARDTRYVDDANGDTFRSSNNEPFYLNRSISDANHLSGKSLGHLNSTLSKGRGYPIEQDGADTGTSRIFSERLNQNQELPLSSSSRHEHNIRRVGRDYYSAVEGSHMLQNDTSQDGTLNGRNSRDMEMLSQNYNKSTYILGVKPYSGSEENPHFDSSTMGDNGRKGEPNRGRYFETNRSPANGNHNASSHSTVGRSMLPIYGKLTHPLEPYLAKTPMSDGSDLVDFLLAIFKIRNTKLITDNELMLLIKPYTSGELSEILSEALDVGIQFWDFVKRAVEIFVSPREQFRLINEKIYRLQREEESMEAFVKSIKEWATILQTGLTEEALVGLIVDGLCVSDRLRIAGYREPVSFEDLQHLMLKVRHRRPITTQTLLSGEDTRNNTINDTGVKPGATFGARANQMGGDRSNTNNWNVQNRSKASVQNVPEFPRKFKDMLSSGMRDNQKITANQNYNGPRYRQQSSREYQPQQQPSVHSVNRAGADQKGNQGNGRNLVRQGMGRPNEINRASVIECYVCGDNHLRRNCPKLTKNSTATGAR